MEAQHPAVAEPFPDRRTLRRSPYVARLEAMAVGDRIRIPMKHRTRVSVLATRWGRRWGRKFKTSALGKTVALVGRVA